MKVGPWPRGMEGLPLNKRVDSAAQLLGLVAICKCFHLYITEILLRLDILQWLLWNECNYISGYWVLL